MRTWLFEYDYSGEKWAVEVEAENERLARGRLAAMATATLQGELIEKVPARTGIKPRLVAQTQN